MIQDELLYSDVIYIGGKLIQISSFKKEFPNWYEKWKLLNTEYTLNEYLFIPDYEFGVSATLNGIYSIDFEKATAEYLCSFEDKKNEGAIYHPPIRIENKLIFAPCNARRWAYYNLDKREWLYKEMPAEYIQGDGFLIKSWVLVRDMLVYMPGCTNVLIIMDLKTGEISYHDCLNGIRKEDGKLPKFSSVIAYGDSVLFFTITGNNVYEIDTKTMQLTKVHRVPLDCQGILSATSIPETDWIFLLEHSRATRIIKWDIKTGSIEVISDLPIQLDEDSTPGLILGFCYDYSGLYIIPQKDNCIIKIDYQQNKAIRIELHTEINLLDRKDEFYHRWGYGLSYTPLAYNGYENTSTVFLPYDFSIAEIDFQNGTFYNKRKWRVNGIENLVRDSMKSQMDGMYIENNYFTAKEFIEDIIGK